MTENEYTIDELIDFMYNVMDDSDEEAIPFVKEVIQALEEVQRYRAIGTVEELEAMKKGTLSAMELADIWCVLEDLKKYSAIGTAEEFKALKEKAEPKKPISIDEWSEYWKCPTCGKLAVDNFGCKFKFCRECGTKFNWS